MATLTGAPASEGMKTLPGRYYTDPEMYRRELERFFFGSWICAGRAEDIPNAGDYFLREVAGESLIVVRDTRGSVQAFYNVCRHRGTRMCTGAGGNLGGRIQCPYHGWTYGLDGRLLGAPHMSGTEFRAEDYPLHRVGTTVWDGHVFLHLGEDATPLWNQLGELPQKFARWEMANLRLHRRIVYELKANWKLVVLNYNECLHCPLLHPSLNRLTDYLGSDNEAPGADADYVGGAMGFRDGAETMSTDGKRRREYLPGLSDEERAKVYYYAIYPNFLLSLHPDYMMVHRIWPHAVDRTTVECEWYFEPGAMKQPGFTAEDAIEFWDRTNREDWEIVEQSQLGIQSRKYVPGPYSHRESLLHSFEQAVAEGVRASQNHLSLRDTPVDRTPAAE